MDLSAFGYILISIIVWKLFSRSLNAMLYHCNVRKSSNWLSNVETTTQQYAIYRGTFKSVLYKVGIEGYIVAVIPHPLPRDKSFTARVMIHYDVIGIHKCGGINKFEVDGFLPAGSNSGSGGDVTRNAEGNIVRNENMHYHKKISFSSMRMKGYIGGSPIEYQSMVGMNDGLIVGGYTYIGDYGQFEMKRTEIVARIEELKPELNKTWCPFPFSFLSGL